RTNGFGRHPIKPTFRSSSPLSPAMQSVSASRNTATSCSGTVRRCGMNGAGSESAAGAGLIDQNRLLSPQFCELVDNDPHCGIRACELKNGSLEERFPIRL